MSSPLPSRFNNYNVTTTTTLTADFWNGSVGDLALRMVAVEAKATGYDQLVQEGIGVALNQINEALVPAVTQVQTLITQTNGYLTQLKANTIAASLIVTDPNDRFVTDSEIAQIGMIPNLQGVINKLLANSLLRGRAFYYATM